MTRARLGALAAVLVSMIVLPAVGALAQEGDRRALVVEVPQASLEELMNVPEVQALARSGGAGLLVPQLGRRNLVYGQSLPDEVRRSMILRIGLPDLGRWLDRLVPTSGGDEQLIIVAGVDPRSPAMRAH